MKVQSGCIVRSPPVTPLVGWVTEITMKKTIIMPTRCEECVFFDHKLSDSQGVLFSCRFYSNHKNAPRIGGDKFPFCRVESIIIKERDSAKVRITRK